MLLTWHIVKKDLHRLWPWLALLVGAIAVRYALGWHVEHHVSPGPILLGRSAIGEGILLGLQLFVGALFAAQLIHEDTTNSDGAFWLTRPLSGLRLLTAKILTLLLGLYFLPVLAVLCWWWLHDFRASEFAACLPEFVARQGALIACSLAAALFTRTLGGFFLGTIAASLVLWLQIAADTRWTVQVPPGLSNSRTVLCLTLTMLMLGTCAYLKYRRRHGRLPAVLVAATMVAGSAIGAWWPYDFVTAFRPETYSFPTAAPIGLQLTVDAAPGVQSAAFDFRFTNIPADHRVEVRSLKLRQQNAEGTFDLPFSSLALSPVYNAVAQKTVNPFVAPDQFTYRTALPTPITAGSRVNFLTRAFLRREEILANMPVTTGAQAKSGSYKTRITRVRSAFPPVRSVNTLSVFAARQVSENGSTESHFGYFLHELLRGEDPIRRPRRLFVIGSSSQSVDAMVVKDNLQIDQVRYVFENFHYKAGADPTNDRLVHITYPLLGRFERELSIPMPHQKSR